MSDEFDGSIDEFTEWFLQNRRANKSQESRDQEQQVRDNVFKYMLNIGPLRRSLLKAVKNEDFDYEFIVNEEIPFGYMFGQSLDGQVDEWRSTSTNPDIKEAEAVALRALTDIYIYQTKNDLHNAMSLCQSPIEAIMLAALITVNAKQNRTLVLGGPHRRWPYTMVHKAGNSSAAIKITPQAALDDYTVDFLLEYQVVHVDYPPDAMAPAFGDIQMIVKPEMAIYERIRKRLIVECDGHDFHEKTKEQAARDKRRDRTLQALGYKVFRFTGSEVYKDAIACAKEVFTGFIIDTGTSEPAGPPREA